MTLFCKDLKKVSRYMETEKVLIHHFGLVGRRTGLRVSRCRSSPQRLSNYCLGDFTNCSICKKEIGTVFPQNCALIDLQKIIVIFAASKQNIRNSNCIVILQRGWGGSDINTAYAKYRRRHAKQNI